MNAAENILIRSYGRGYIVEHYGSRTECETQEGVDLIVREITASAQLFGKPVKIFDRYAKPFPTLKQVRAAAKERQEKLYSDWRITIIHQLQEQGSADVDLAEMDHETSGRLIDEIESCGFMVVNADDSDDCTRIYIGAPKEAK